jgi:hypothetical protein
VNKAVKWVLIAVAVAVASNVTREALKASDEVDAKIALESSCARMAEQAGGVSADHVVPVCHCTAEKTQQAVGPDGLIRLSKVSEATDADKMAVITSIASCREELDPPPR